EGSTEEKNNVSSVHEIKVEDQASQVAPKNPLSLSLSDLNTNAKMQRKYAATKIGMTKHTLLHIACARNDVEAVKILLESGAAVNTKDYLGRTPVFIATAFGHTDCLELLLNLSADPNIPIESEDIIQSSVNDYLTEIGGICKVPMVVWSGSTALHEAVRYNNLECAEILLDNGADVNAKDRSGVAPILLAGTGLKADQEKDIFNYDCMIALLIKKGANASAKNNEVPRSALLNAVYLESLPALQSLLDAGADPGWSSENGGSSTAMHEAAARGRADLLKALICSTENQDRRQELVNMKDAVDRTPLHKAAYAGSRECVSLLLENGANLSLTSKAGISGMDAVMKSIPEPESFIDSLFNSCITCNSSSSSMRDFTIYLNFSILVPNNRRQTAVLNALFTSSCIKAAQKRAMLLHPLVEAFVRFKWNILWKYFLPVVIVYAMYVSTLSSFAVLLKMQTENIASHSISISILRFLHLFFSLIVIIIVMSQCIIQFRYYIKQYETWTNGLSAILSIIWNLVSITYLKLGEKIPPWTDHIIVVTLPLAWAGMMLLLGRFPMWGSRALLFGTVLKNVLWTLLVLGCIVVGFAFSFFIQFHESNPDAFGSIWKSFFNTMVMMTGEFEYLDIFTDKKIYLPVTSRVLYVIFIVMASIVLLNLIVGLAVADTQVMNSESEARSLYKRVEFVDFLECISLHFSEKHAIKRLIKMKVHRIPMHQRAISARALPKPLVDSLISIALKERAKGNLDKKEKVMKNLSSLISLPNATLLEQKILCITEKYLEDVFEIINANRHSTISQ
ncbi:hypothetical protein J437_LFUL002057, partial [Ladona fulva]